MSSDKDRLLVSTPSYGAAMQTMPPDDDSPPDSGADSAPAAARSLGDASPSSFPSAHRRRPARSEDGDADRRDAWHGSDSGAALPFHARHGSGYGAPAGYATVGGMGAHGLGHQQHHHHHARGSSFAPNDPLEKRHAVINTMFGFTPWKAHVAKKELHDRTPKMRALYQPLNDVPESVQRIHVPITFDNAIWVILFGWWLWVVYHVVALVLLCTGVGYYHALACHRLGNYFIWPFGRFLVAVQPSARPRPGQPAHFGSGVLRVLGDAVWLLLGLLPIGVAHLAAAFFTWFSVYLIPIAKVNVQGLRALAIDPLRLVPSDSAPRDIILFTMSAGSRRYFKYTVAGFNVCLFNLLPFVVVVLVLGFGTSHQYREENAIMLFGMAALGTVPLAYYIGMAIHRIAAMTSFGVGAVLNATFGSIIELILYAQSLKKGYFILVKQAVTGTFIGMLLLLPGLSMVVGGLRYKEQRFNKNAAGVSSVLLILAVVGAFLPTLTYGMFKNNNFECPHCVPDNAGTAGISCSGCQAVGDDHHLLETVISPITTGIAIIFPLAYLMGLVFTLRTHSHIYEEGENEPADTAAGDNAGGEAAPQAAAPAHDQPIGEWSVTRCVVIMLVSTVLFALVSEVMVESIRPALKTIGISESFAGFTIIATITSLAEYVNAVKFAWIDDISLSLEIGSSAAIQVAFIQIPALLIVSKVVAPAFWFVFNQMAALGIIFGVLIFNYLSIDGRSNYFEGFACMVLYVMITLAFYYIPEPLIDVATSPSN